MTIDLHIEKYDAEYMEVLILLMVLRMYVYAGAYTRIHNYLRFSTWVVS